MKKIALLTLFAPLSLSAILTLSGCVSKIDVHGKYITEEQVKQIEISKHNKNDVEELLGSPSNESPFDGNIWYYVGRKTSKTSFFNPVLVDFKGYAIHFNEDGYVDKFAQLTKEDLIKITPARRYTPTAGHEMSILEQMGSYVKRGAVEKKKR